MDHQLIVFQEAITPTPYLIAINECGLWVKKKGERVSGVSK